MSDQGFLRGGKFLGFGEGKKRDERTRRGASGRAGGRRSLRKGLRSPALEALEERLYFAGDPIPVHFDIPPDVAALGVYIEVSGQLTADYQSKAGNIGSGSEVYYDASIGDYAVAGYGLQLTFALAGNGAVLELPNTPIKAGQIVIGVGSPPNVIYNGQAIATPTSSTNPTNYFGLFEFAITGAGLDIDLSEVDQVGFPFTITTDPTAPVPANDGVGIPLTRAEMFERYGVYIASQGATAALFMQSLTAGNGYRIEAPQDILDGQQAPTLGAPTYSAGGSLPIGPTYYYWVTATSPSGETRASNVMVAVPYNLSSGGANYPQQTVHMSWGGVGGATGYNIYRSTTNNPATGGYVGSSVGTSFSDPGYAATGQHPPANSYTFNPLNAYFNDALKDFFDHYTATDSFQMVRDTYLFKGQVNSNLLLDGNTYTALELHTDSLPGQTFLIFKPYFSTNTNIANAPPPPSWMPHPDQSPAAMIMANDGAFNTGGAQPGVDAGILSDLENSIVSAFNRGIATTFSIKPNNWAAQPVLESATASAGGSLTVGKTYFYVVTSVNADGETTTSVERAVTATAGNQSATLSWVSNTVPTEYKIYRTETSGSGYQLVDTIPNDNGHGQPATGYTDHDTTTLTNATPPMYYAPGTLANWYAAFLHQNVTTNPGAGISINGLAYGFPYDDQGGDSTNFQSSFNSVTIDLMPWGHMPTPHGDAAGIQILLQPNSGPVGGTATIEFQVLNAVGAPLLGATSVTVQILGAQQGYYTVVTDPYSGIGVLSVLNRTFGFDKMQLSIGSGVTVDSRIYQVFGGFGPNGGGGGGGIPGGFPGDFPGSNFTIPGQTASVSTLGPNALPASDVPNATSVSWLNAPAWGPTEGELPALAASWGGATFRLNSLEDGPLGNLIQMARTGHSIAPEQLPQPADQSVPPKRQANAPPAERQARASAADRPATERPASRKAPPNAGTIPPVVPVPPPADLSAK